MKKIISIFISLSLLGALLTGCAPKEPVTITVWHYYNGPLQTVFEQTVADFNQSAGREKGVILETVQLTDIDELTERVIAASEKRVGADPLPDLIFAYSSTALELDSLGLLADMAPYFTEQELDRYLPAYIDEGRIGAENKLLSFPVAKSTEVVYVENMAYSSFKDIVPEADDALFSTYEGIAELAELYYTWTDSQTPDIPNDGKAFFGVDATPNFISVCARQLSGNPPVTVTSGTPTLTLDKETARRLWNYYYPAIVTGRFAEIGWYRADDMKAGELIAYIGSSGGATYFPDQIALPGGSYETELACFPQPVFADAQKVTIQQGAGLSMLKTAEPRQKAAAEFLKWFTAPEQNVAYSMASGYSPVQKADYTGDLLTVELQKLRETGDKTNSNIALVLERASEQMNGYTLTVDKEYPGSYDMRNLMGMSMSAAAQSAREGYVADLASGMDEAAARARYVTDDAFERWYNGVITGFDALNK